MAVPERIFKTHSELFQPQTNELNILKKQEQIDFKVVPYTGLSEGRQSRVSVLEYRLDQNPQRVLWKRMGAGKGLTPEEARLFHERLLPYRASLQKHGWRVPILFYTQTVNIAEESQVFSYEELITGGDGEKIIINNQEPNFKKWFMLHATMETLMKYPQLSLQRKIIMGHKTTLLPHGLDLKLANLVLNEQGQLYFVDLFGPKELKQDGKWLTYSQKLDSLPEQNLLAVCATREGVILRFYRLLEKLWCATADIKTTAMRHAFKDMLATLDTPRKELNFIASEIDHDFPWLNEIYAEKKV